jgi:thioredoxin 1
MLRSLALLSCLAAATQAFAPLPASSLRRQGRTAVVRNLVVEVGSEEQFDKAVATADDALVIVDFSTTWCGPCKVIEPKFVELSDQFSNAVFLKVVGDASPGASALMKREGVRSVPSFHFWKSGKKVDQVNGANTGVLESTVMKYV